jgi:glycosyltransferase involved in cell wall biosynthesis
MEPGPVWASPPLVSVVTIFLDAQDFIEEAIASVIAQTYPRWELLLVDDGSTDDSPAIAQEYARRHPDRIRYLTHPGGQNLGMSAARNLGIRAARGDYLAFLDADDVYLPHKLEAQVSILEREPAAGMVYGPSLHWHSWNPAAHRGDLPRKLGAQADQLIRPPVLLARYLRLEAQTPATCAVLVRRDVVAAAGGFEDQFRGLYEDQVFFYKVASRWPIYVESTSRDLYRQHPRSHAYAARQKGDWADGRPAVSYERFLRWLVTYLADVGIDDPELRRAIHGELWPYRSRIHRHVASSLHAIRRAWRSALRMRPRATRRN